MKDLYRTKDKMIAGVAGGIAKHFDTDPTLIRVAFAVSLLFAGSGAVIYLILMLVIPMEGETQEKNNNENTMKAEKNEKNSIIGGLVLITLGVLFLLNNYFPAFNFSDLWPVILVAIGVGLLLQKKNKDSQEEKDI